MAEVKVNDLPSISNISVSAVNVGDTLSLVPPTFIDNGEPVAAQGWEISADGSTNWTIFDSEAYMTYVHNEQYLRYYATNSVGTGYSNSVQLTVNKLNLSLSLSCEDITYGETPDPLLSGNTGGGTVTYKYKAQDAPDTDYTADVPANAGDYTVLSSVSATDTYNGDSATAEFTIHKAIPGIILTASPENNSLAGDSVTLTASLTGVLADNYPTGSIVFKNGGTILGTTPIDNGEASYNWQNIPYGRHNLTAEYAGDNNYENTSGSISHYDIQKKTQDALFITGVPQAIVYGDSSFTLGSTGGSGDGSVTYTS